MWREIPLREPVLLWTNKRGWEWATTPEEVMSIIGESNDLRLGFELDYNERECFCRVLKEEGIFKERIVSF